jgi:2-polyprenyl-3-methyl-5-hydroxy-6-metoxy-1,4-benzoquinol methylase
MPEQAATRHRLQQAIAPLAAHGIERRYEMILNSSVRQSTGLVGRLYSEQGKGKRYRTTAFDGENGLNGGYDDGYSRCPCFWGKSAGSLVQRFVSDQSFARGVRVLDLGSGEGKNAFAFANAGASVVAVDCSALGLANGQREFADAKIEWVLFDAETYLRECEPFDVIVMYGLLHCLPSTAAMDLTT